MLYQLTYISPKPYALEIEGKIIREKETLNQRLAYPINHLDSGYYKTILFTSTAKKIKELEDKIKLDKNIIRHLIVKDVPKETPKEEKREKAEVSEEQLEEKLKEILS